MTEEQLLEMRSDAETAIARAVRDAASPARSPAWFAEVTRILESKLAGAALAHALELLQDRDSHTWAEFL